MARVSAIFFKNIFRSRDEADLVDAQLSEAKEQLLYAHAGKEFYEHQVNMLTSRVDRLDMRRRSLASAEEDRPILREVPRVRSKGGS